MVSCKSLKKRRARRQSIEKGRIRASRRFAQNPYLKAFEMKAVILVNPHAGRQGIVKEIDGVRKVFEENDFQTEIIQTENAEQAAGAIQRALKAGPDVLVCCGGDGTLSETVSVMLEAGADIPLGYIPAGTTNDFASSLGIPKEPVKAAERVVFGKPERMDAGRFGDRSFIYVASFGAFTQSSYQTNQAMKNSLGHFAYVLEGLKELPALKPCRMRVETAEGGVYEGDYIFGALSNSTSIGGVMKLDPAEVDPADGKFELILVKNPKNLLEFNRVILSLVNGKYDEELVVFTHTERAVFTCGQPVVWSLDGEYADGGERVEAEALHGALRLYY